MGQRVEALMIIVIGLVAAVILAVALYFVAIGTGNRRRKAQAGTTSQGLETVHQGRASGLD
jgi:hypothetical protein